MLELPPQLPYYVLLLAALLTAFGAAVGAATGARARWFFLHSAGLTLVAGGLALLVITTGPAPLLSREELRPAIYWLLFVGGSVWLLWAALYNLHIVRVHPRRERRGGNST